MNTITYDKGKGKIFTYFLPVPLILQLASEFGRTGLTYGKELTHLTVGLKTEETSCLK